MLRPANGAPRAATPHLVSEATAANPVANHADSMTTSKPKEIENRADDQPCQRSYVWFFVRCEKRPKIRPEMTLRARLLVELPPSVKGLPRNFGHSAPNMAIEGKTQNA